MNKKTQTVAFSNLIGAVIFLAVGVWAYFQMANLQEVKDTYAQPSMFPMIMIAGLLIFSVILLIQSVVKLTKGMKEGDPAAEQTGSINVLKDKGVQGALVVIVLCVAFVLLFRVLGYVLAGAIVSAAIMYLIGKRNIPQMVLVSVLVPLVMWLIFYKVLTINIPLGPLNFLRTLVDMI